MLGGRGPEGYPWPIPYLLPWSDAWQVTWRGQWALNAWPNFAVTGVLLALMLYLAWKRGSTPLECLSSGANESIVRTLRARFGEPGG